MKKSLLTALSMLFILACFGQNANLSQDYSVYFEEAYEENPTLPRGILEAVAYTRTHIRHISANEPASCTGLPRVYGVMGLTLDGQNYFNENLKVVAKNSDYTISEIINSPEASIKAYAQHMAEASKLLVADKNDPASYRILLFLDSEIPHDSTNRYAKESHIYSVFSFLNDSRMQNKYNFPSYHINMEKVFGKENLEILSAPKVLLSKKGVSTPGGKKFKATNVQKSAQYPPAIWTPAPSCNYSSRGVPVSAITIHTIQGSYAGAISWAQNCNSNVSYHYVIRSSDGQVTQMVDEADKAWHVGSENPYTIGYEHEGYVSDPSWYTTAMYTSSADLSRDIVNSGYGINPLRTYFGASSSGTNTLGGCTKIKGHQHYPNQSHTDPGINWDWERYYQLINSNPTINTLSTTTGNWYDSGGAAGDYSDDERDFTLIQPVGATSVSVTFSAFNLETNWDYLYIYDGASTSDPLIGIYTGMSNPGTVAGTTGALLMEFRSDCATTASGWAATWTSNINPNLTDSISPTTLISGVPTWATSNFVTNFTDADELGGSGLEKSYYQVADWDGLEWRANGNSGFFNDDFDNMSIHSEWTTATGNWAIQSNSLVQSDEAESNTNIYASVNQSVSNRYLYNWAGKIDGSGTNRRAGFHFACDDASLPNRGNSYFVWYRVDDNKIQIYSVDNDVFTLQVDHPYTINAGQWYDFKVIYDQVTGVIDVFVDNIKEATWTDATPIQNGNAISFRSGNASYDVNRIQVYRSRPNNETITIGQANTNNIRYQNPDPLIPAGRISSIVIDSATNFSSVNQVLVDVDWTNPSDITTINDGNAADIDTIYTNTELAANWSLSIDGNSAIARYWYAIGTSAGATDIVGWTDNWFNDTVVHTGLNLAYNQTYYFSVKSENGAGLESAVISSDGAYLEQPTSPPTASYNYSNTYICANDSVFYSNSSANATSYAWTFQNGSPATSTAPNPAVAYTASGTYDAMLIASGPGGTDTVTQSVVVNVDVPPTASFTVSQTTLYLPNAIAYFTNASADANGYLWVFGDGNQSVDIDPWHEYTAVGTYNVMLIAVNGLCPNDTAYNVIHVEQDISIEEQYNQIQMSVYPNPATQQSYIEFTLERASELEIELIDAVGKRVWHQAQSNFGSGSNRIEIGNITQNLAQGTYIIRMVGDGLLGTAPLIITNE